MTDTPFDETPTKEEYQKTKKFVDAERVKSSLKALKDEGYVFAGNNFANRVINVIKHLNSDPRTKGLFLFNEWMDHVEYTRAPFWDKTIQPGKPIDDNDPIYIKQMLAQDYKYEPSKKNIEEALFLVGVQKKINPVKEFIESVKWDGQERLKTWLPMVCRTDDNEYTRMVGEKWIHAMVARVYHPGVKFDNLIVLEGKEALLKSTMLRVLGGEWYAPFSIKAESKDAVHVMIGKWLLEMEELATLRASEVEYVDAFLSRTSDRVRLSYAHYAKDFPRKCILVGTMNPIGNNQYLRKQSENRRFWPIECKDKLDLDWVKKNRQQLFAEALVKYNPDELYLTDSKAIQISVYKLEERKTQDAWTDIIYEFLKGKSIVSLVEIITQALQVSKDKINHSVTCRVGICMRQLGWVARRHGPDQQKYYIRQDAPIEEQLINKEISFDGEEEGSGDSRPRNNEQSDDIKTDV